MTAVKKTKKQLDAEKQLWKLGVLSWKLEPPQKMGYDFFKDPKRKIAVLNFHRRFGKGFSSLTYAIEECIKNKHHIVKFLAPEIKQIRFNMIPIIREIFKDAPDGLKFGTDVKFSKLDNVVRFPNGSEIQFAGADNGNAENLRGGFCHLAICDEVGFVNDLKYIINSILLPTTLTTNGKIVLTSTPPRQGDHEFVDYMQNADFNNNLMVLTIEDYFAIWKKHTDKTGVKPTRVTRENLQPLIDSMGGIHSSEYKREFLCMVATAEEDKVVPEFTSDIEEEIVQEWERPPFYDSYTSMDIGVRDLTAVLFGYYDYANDKLIIEDEYTLNGKTMTTDVLAENIQDKEKTLWVDPVTKEVMEPYMRVSDNNLLVIQDLTRLHGMYFIPTKKHDKGSAVNDVRQRIASRQIIINPKCKNLIKHLRYGSWDKTGKKFSHLSDGSHADCLDALIYMVRNISWGKNPYPRGYQFSRMGGNLFVSPKFKDHRGDFKERLAEVFKPKKYFNSGRK